ncbi:MAG: hypothetical protein KU28_03840 [Sulfurovum sp. PC08-66]|nr:MAG: hypothetical protein KU28_03840 [Sulfurovum sp. PC08-66]
MHRNLSSCLTTKKFKTVLQNLLLFHIEKSIQFSYHNQTKTQGETPISEDITIFEILESQSNKATCDDKSNRIDIKVKNHKEEIILIRHNFHPFHSTCLIPTW